MQSDITQTTQTDMANKVTDYSLDTYSPDVAADQKETNYTNTNYHTQLGVFKNSPHFHRAVTALVTWSAGRGYETDTSTKVLLENIIGWGEDTFDSIMMAMLILKKVTGDAFAEIIRNDKGSLINLKVLGGDSIRTVVDRKGIILRYEQVSRTGGKTSVRRIRIQDMLHLCNDRIADEIHGVSLAELVSWIVTAIRESETDWKRISHRSTIRVMYIDEDDKTRIANLKTDYAEAIKNGELIIIPAKKGDVDFEDLILPPVDAFLRWMSYLEGQFYQVVGVPRVIATSEGFTESSSKMGVFSFNPTHEKESMQLEADLWNQVAIRVKFNRPPSLTDNLQRDEGKDVGQMGMQPNDTEVGVGK